MVLRKIFIYPIKSLAGIEMDACSVDKFGLLNDRRYMLVNERNEFLTQRDLAVMALLKTRISDGQLEIESSNDNRISIPLSMADGEAIHVKIWNDHVQALRVSAEADQFFSDQLGMRCSLVYMPYDSERIVNKKYVTDSRNTSFTDGYPILLIGTASLDDLNSRLDVTVGMDRFRPSLVVDTAMPFDEDYWAAFTIGALPFNGVKLCSRCVVTTIDQQTAVAGKEPLRTLAQYRNMNHGVYFGQNVVCRAEEGVVRVGDAVTVGHRANPLL